MARLPDIAHLQIIEAAHINDRYDENYLWADHVDAGGKNLSNVGQLSASSAITATPGMLGAAAGSQLQAFSAAYVDGGSGIVLETLAYRTSVTPGHGSVELQIGRKVDVTRMGYIGFGSEYTNFVFGGSEAMKLEPAGVIRLPLLPSANPGAGTKQLWYDPADGNRVKFAA